MRGFNHSVAIFITFTFESCFSCYVLNIYYFNIFPPSERSKFASFLLDFFSFTRNSKNLSLLNSKCVVLLFKNPFELLPLNITNFDPIMVDT